MSQPHPFLIIISQEIPHSQAAGSIQLLRLLEDWPVDRIVVCGPEVPRNAVTLGCDYVKFRPNINRLQNTRFTALCPPLSWLVPLSLPRVSVDQPAIVLTVMQSSAFCRAAGVFAARQRLPLAMIIHDDPEELESVRWWTRPVVRSFNRGIYRAASARFCISPEMNDMMSERYYAQGEVLYPVASREEVPRPIEQNYVQRRPHTFVVGYAGSMAYGYGDRLLELLSIFARIGVTLRIYSLDRPRFLKHSAVEYAGAFATPREIFQRLKLECDAVILPYATTNGRLRALYRTHFPSKLPEYLGLGMPVIITGPTDATGLKWGLRNREACVTVLSNADDAWPSIINGLRDNPEIRVSLSKGALLAGKRDFAPEIITRYFKQRLFEEAYNGALS